MQTISLFLTILLLLSSLNSTSNAADSDRVVNPLITELIYIKDNDRQLTPGTALKTLRGPDANVINGSVFNIGASEGRHWLYLDAYTQSRDADSLRLLASVPYRALLKVYTIDADDRLQMILHESKTKPFNTRTSSYRYLSSKPIDVSAQTNVRLLIEYEVVGSSYLPFSLVSESELNQIVYDDSIGAAFFYSFSIAAIIIFVLFSLAMQDRNAAMYGVLFMLGLLTIASMEGFAFKYLWPELPGWNNLSPLVLLFILSGFGFWLSSVASRQSTTNNIYRRALRYLAIVSLVLAGLCFALPFVALLNIAGILLMLMFASLAYTVIETTSLIRKRNLVSMLTAIPLAIFVIIVALVSLDISFLPDSIYLSSPRIIYIVGSLGTMGTIMAHVSGLRLDHEQALENELVLVKREAETNRALFEAEQNYSRAKEIARARQQQLATASHDMRQPLVSLRSTMDAIAHNESDKVRTQLRNAFDYLENLCNNYLKSTRPEYEDEIEKNEPKLARSENVEPYSVNLIIDTANRMFADEAQQKGLSLRCRPSSVSINKSPLIVMRIVTNLLSNAIKHTDNGKILLGARRRKHSVAIQIIDTGCGMNEEQLATLSQAYEKGPDSSGEGLGLAICRQQAEQNGMRFNIRSIPGKGTCCEIEMETAD